MSTDQTPALARATEALAAAQLRTVTPMHALDARTALSAALHDPDDPDWLARSADPEAFELRTSDEDPATSGTVRHNRVRDVQILARRKIARDHADAVRAAILGADS